MSHIHFEAFHTDPKPLLTLFWGNVQRCAHGQECHQCCWLWFTRKSHTGYGAFYVPKRYAALGHQGTHIASRISWELHHGAIPADLCVLHNCPDGDNPACVNPAHLWLGTPQDNSRDAVMKGRVRKGEAHGMCLHPEAVSRGGQHYNARLQPEDILSIFQYIANGMTYQEVGEIFGVCPGTITCVIKRKTWKHIPMPQDLLTQVAHRPNLSIIQGEKQWRATLTAADVLRIRALAITRMPYTDIAAMFHISRSNVGCIVARKAWAHLPPLPGELEQAPRRTQGEENASAKLTTQDVVDMRRLAKEGMSFVALAKRYQITEGYVSMIVHRKAWKHLPEE